MVVAFLCEKMGWDYETYYRQPVHFIDLLLSKFEVDNKNAERASRGVK